MTCNSITYQSMTYQSISDHNNNFSDHNNSNHNSLTHNNSNQNHLGNNINIDLETIQESKSHSININDMSLVDEDSMFILSPSSTLHLYHDDGSFNNYKKSQNIIDLSHTNIVKSSFDENKSDGDDELLPNIQDVRIRDSISSTMIIEEELAIANNSRPSSSRCYFKTKKNNNNNNDNNNDNNKYIKSKCSDVKIKTQSKATKKNNIEPCQSISPYTPELRPSILLYPPKNGNIGNRSFSNSDQVMDIE